MNTEIKLSVWKKYTLLLLLFSCLTVSLLSPLASNVYLPATELSYHVSAAIQAKVAIEEGQFPIRTIPWQEQSWGNPWFQFHSPLPYTLAGFIYKYISPDNPYVAIKLVIFLGFVLAALGMYKLILWLLKSETIAILTAIVYIISPYFLINIHARGDFTEAMAQAIVPLVLYFSFRLYFANGIKLSYLILSAIAWCCLITTCIITFVYTAIFLGILFLMLTLQHRYRLQQLLYTGLAFLYSLCLSAYFIVPILITEKLLMINKLLALCYIMPIGSGVKHQWLDYMVDSFEISKWINPLPTLLSMTAVSPIPLPGQNLLSNYPIYLSIGLPIILSVGCIIYLIAAQKSKNESVYLALSTTLMILFFVAFFAAWSPINFWVYLPKFLTITQFSYRLLTQVMWIGAILFALAVFLIFREKFDIQHLIVGIILVCLCNSSWIPTQIYSKQIQEVIDAPDLGYGQFAYLVTPDAVNLPYANNSKLDISSAGGWLTTNKDILFNRQLFPKNSSFQLIIDGEVPKLFKHPVSVDLYVNDKHIQTKVIAPGGFQWNIPLGEYLTDKNSKIMSLKFMTKDFFVPKNTMEAEKIAYAVDARPLSIKINSSALAKIDGGALQQNTIGVKSILNSCNTIGKYTQCHFSIPSGMKKVQLPVFYYPRLLTIKVNGKQTNYFPTQFNDFVLATVVLSPGDYTVISYFNGISWANWLSLLAWIAGLIILLGCQFIRSKLYTYKWRD